MRANYLHIRGKIRALQLSEMIYCLIVEKTLLFKCQSLFAHPAPQRPCFLASCLDYVGLQDNYSPNTNLVVKEVVKQNIRLYMKLIANSGASTSSSRGP